MSFDLFIFICVSFISAGIAYVLIYVHSGNNLSINFTTFWFLNFILFCFIGCIWVTSGLADDSYFVLPISSNSTVKLWGGYLSLWGGVAPFYIFIMFSNLFFNSKKIAINRCSTILVEKSDIFAINTLMVVSVILFIYYIYSTYPSPLGLALSGGDAVAIASRRIQVTKDLSQIANTYLIYTGMLLVVLVSYAYVAICYVNNKYYLVKWVSIFIACVYLLLNGEKAPLVYYIIGLFVASHFARGSEKKISLMFVLLSVLIVFLIYYILVSQDVNKIVMLILDRVFIAQLIAVYLSLEHYSPIGDIGFSSLSNILTKILSLDTAEPASAVLMSVYYPEMLELGGWNVNGIYIHEAWANFGLLGVILAPFVVGVQNGLFYGFVLSVKKRPFVVSIYSYATVKCTYYLTSFNAYFYHSDWVLFFIVISLYFMIKAIYKYGASYS